MLYWCLLSRTSLRTHWKNMLYWCLLSRTSLRTHWKNMLYWCLLSQLHSEHWKTCFTGVLVKLHSEHTEKTCFTGVCWVELHSEHTEKTCFTGVCWVELHSEHTEKTCFTGVCWVELHSEHTEKHALLVFVESNFTQNTLKNMLYWCLLSQTSLRTHWKTCFTGVCWVKLHSEHTEKHALLVFVESNFTQNTLKNMLYWCLLSRTSLRTHWKTCFTGVCWVELHSEHTEKHALLVFVESNFTQNTLKNMLYWCLLSRTSLRTHWKNMLYWCFSRTSLRTHWKNMLYWCLLSQTSLRTHWKTCFTGVCWVELHSEHTEKHALLVFVESNFTQNTLKKHALLVF